MTSFLKVGVSDADQPRLDTGMTAQDAFAAAASTASGRDLGLDARRDSGARDEIYAAARTSAAGIQIQHAFPGWAAVISNMHSTAIRRLAADKPVDPNTPATWASVDAHAQAVLRRHHIADVQTRRLTNAAVHALVAGQADADTAAGLDWSVVHADPTALDEQLAAARRRLPIDLADPRSWAYPQDQRDVLARSVGVHGDDIADLSRWVLANPGDFGVDKLRSWRIGSKQWMRIASGRLDPVGDVDRPVGVFLAPHIKAGWCLMPCLSLDMIRLVIELGGSIDQSLRRATLPADAAGALLERINVAALHAGSTEMIENLGDLSKALTEAFGQTVSAVSSTDKRDRWGRITVGRLRWKTKSGVQEQLTLDVLTFTTKGFAVKRFGAVRASSMKSMSTSLALELGEAVGIAIDGGIPLLLSSEAAGALGDTVLIGCMSGRPGMVTITSSDGVAAVTERLVAEQAVNRVRMMQRGGVNAKVDARAKRILRMTAARPLQADPVLLPPQQTVAAQMAVGSGLNASDVGTGKTVTTARGALYQRAATTPAMRGLVVADGRLVKQWYDALTIGAPHRGMPPLLMNAHVAVANERTPLAAQVRAFHRRCARGAGVLLVSDSIMERHGGDLALINWHVLIADEADRYANPATEAHKALVTLRTTAVLDCWLLTATPKGRNREDLDVLVGIAIGDQTMIRDRVATRESGDLMDERNSHRLRRDYGAHLVRITESEMAQYKPKIRKAKAIVVEADPALRDLLTAIREGGQAAYRELLRLFEHLKTLEKGSDLHKAALVDVARCQGVVLGNVGVFVRASIDPEALKYSNSALAQGLVSQGLVDAAINSNGDGVPTLRAVTAEAIAEACRTEQLLVFSEDVRCLHLLAGTLCARGVDARVGDGKLNDDEFEELKSRFVAGAFPVLLLSRVGEKGHDLQNASGFVNLDVGWVTKRLEQRAGRVARPGSKFREVWSVIPYIGEGGIAYQVGIVAERGAENFQLFDGYEGVRACDSTIAGQLAEITAQVAVSRGEAGYAGDAARLLVAANVFDA